jgi:dienelactone hydrolase
MLQDIIQPFRTSAPSTRTQRHLGTFLVMGWTLALLGMVEASAQDLPANPTQRLDRNNLLLYPDADGTLKTATKSEEWLHRRKIILASMQEVMGPLPGEEKRCALELEIVEEFEADTYIRRLITYRPEPKSIIPAYLLIPKEALTTTDKKFPGVLTLHQTHPLGHKVVVGLEGHANDHYAVDLVKRGFVCLAPAYPLLANYQPKLAALGYRSGTMKAIWDDIRGLDLLESLPYVKQGEFGAIGHSLGGHNAIFTAVFDERIKVIVSSCGFDSFLTYKGGNIKGWTSDRYMPNLLNYKPGEIPFDFHELIGALAPRVCFISAPFYDDNFKWRSVFQINEAAAKIYNLYRVPQNLRVEHPRTGHEFPLETRETAYRILEENLK